MTEFSLARTPLDRADWQRPAAIYGQCLEASSDDRRFLPPPLTGFLAEIIARISPNYHGFEDEFVANAVRAFSAVHPDGLRRGTPAVQLQHLYFDPKFTSLRPYRVPTYRQWRRLPTPVEATVETARRRRDLRDIQAALEPVTAAAVLGGSVSYGRFYNVLGGGHGVASDIDLLVVVDRYETLSDVGEAMAEIGYVNPKDVARFAVRADEFVGARWFERHRPAAFSAKFGLWPDDDDPILVGSTIKSAYQVSMHVVSRDVFAELVFRDHPKVVKEKVGQEMQIADFREAPPSRTDYQRSFSGKSVALRIDCEPVGHSFLRVSRMFYIDNDHRYFPGMLQNLILPAYELQWSNAETRRMVESFRWKMIDRLRHESFLRSNEYLRLSLSHTRSENFAPHAVRAVDEGILLP